MNSTPSNNPSPKLGLPLVPTLLAVSAAGIWLVEPRWMQSEPDVAVIAVLIPLALGMAKNRRSQGSKPATKHGLWLTAMGLTAGVLTGSMTLMAFSWGYLAARFWAVPSDVRLGRLTVLFAGAFPWVLLDFFSVGWAFRLSAATVAAQVFEGLGFVAVSDGTFLTIDGVEISVENACSGLNLLQTLLSAGVALTATQFPTARAFWVLLVALPGLAWVANTTRVMAISWWGWRYGADAAAGAFHTWGALIVLVAALGLFLGTASLLRRTPLGREKKDIE